MTEIALLHENVRNDFFFGKKLIRRQAIHERKLYFLIYNHFSFVFGAFSSDKVEMPGNVICAAVISIKWTHQR